MAENEPIKYSDLISPDDSIVKLTKQLDDIANALELVQDKAVTLSTSMKSMSGATRKGREEIDEAARDAMKLAKAQEDLAYAQSDTAKQLAYLNELKRIQNQRNKEDVKISLSQRGSYARLSARYSQLKRELDNMNPVTEKARRAFEAKQKAAKKLMEQMNELQKATGKYTLQVGNYELAGKSLRKELREITLQLQQMKLRGEENSEEYQKLLARAGELSDTMGDVSQAINKTASDTSNLDAVLGAASAATGGFAVATATMSMLGASTRDVEIAQKKLQEAIALVNGVQAIANALNKDSALVTKVMALQSLALGKAKELEASKTVGATIAQKAFNLVAKANPYVLLATALITVVGALVMFSMRTKEAEERLEATKFAIQKLNNELEYCKSITDEVKSIIGKLGGNELVSSMRTVNDFTISVLKLNNAIEEAKSEIENLEADGVSDEDKKKIKELNLEIEKLGDEWEVVGKKWKQYEIDLTYIRKELENTNKTNKELARNKSVENSLSNQISMLQKKADLYSARNDGQKNIAYEKQIFDLENKAISNQLANLNIRKKSLDNEFAIYKEKVNAQIMLSDAEKEQLITEKSIEIEQKKSEFAIERQNLLYSRQILMLDEELRKIERFNKELQTQRELQMSQRGRADDVVSSNNRIVDAEIERQNTILEAQDTYSNRMRKEELTNRKNLIEIQRKRNSDTIELQRKEADELYAIRHNANLTDEQMKEEANRVSKHYLQLRNDAEEYYNIMSENETRRHANSLNEINKGKSFLDYLGFDMTGEQEQAINTAFQSAISSVNSYIDSLVALKQQSVDTANARVESAQKALDAEIEARNAGYANNVETAQKELQLAKENQRKAEQEAKRMEQVQRKLDTLQQASSLVTATANIWKSFTSAGPAGIGLASLATATMWGAFAAAKIKAAQVTRGTEKYGEGTVELLSGGSHASGNDIDLGIKSDGTRRRAEGGEFFAVINKRNSRKYRKVIPDVIRSINNDTFASKYLNANGKMAGALINIQNTNSTDLRQLQDDVRAIKKVSEKQTYIDARGYMVQINGTNKRIIRR